MDFQSLWFKRKATPSIANTQLHFQADISGLCEAEANWALSLIRYLSFGLGDKVSVSAIVIKMLAFEGMEHIQRYGNLKGKSKPLPEI